VYRPRLTLEIESLEPLRLDAMDVRQVAELAPTVDGKPDWSRIKEVDLEEIGRRSRLQTLAFRAAAEVFDQVKPGWSGGRDALLGQVVRLVERFLASDRVVIEPPLFDRDLLRRRILLALSMPRIVQHLFAAIRHENASARTLVLDREHPLRRTGDMAPWYTARPCAPTTRSHVNFCVFDSTWEASEAFTLDHDAHVDAWVKNDHLGFEVHYVFQGAVRRYRPDFLIRLTNGVVLILEVKGQDADQHRAKRAALAEWVDAVNAHGGFGRWASDVSFAPSDLPTKLAGHGTPLPGDHAAVSAGG
jgi:type III restriction enzyme